MVITQGGKKTGLILLIHLRSSRTREQQGFHFPDEPEQLKSALRLAWSELIGCTESAEPAPDWKGGRASSPSFLRPVKA